MSGIIIDALDQVRITFLLPLRCTAATFLASLASTYGPFFIDRDTFTPLPLPAGASACGYKLVRRLVTTGPVPEGGLAPGSLGSGHPYR